MKFTPLILALAARLSGCEAKAPVAKLQYIDITTSSDGNYHLKFASDQPILDLFAANKNQRVVYAALKCALGDDQNFDIEHSMKHRAEGGFEKAAMPPASSKLQHAFDATIHFWESGQAENQGDQYIMKEDLTVLLKDKATVPCMVRMTVNFSTPYYSEIMQVPTKDLIAVARPRPLQ